MNFDISETDVLGRALESYHESGLEEEILVTTTVSDQEVTPASYFFRRYDQMSPIEQYAMDCCRGTVLDVGAGAGSHSLFLQNEGFEVDSLDSSARLCRLMKKRGVRSVVQSRILDYNTTKKYDSIIMLMNGLGLCANVSTGLPRLMNHLSNMLNPDGQILVDSSDISHMYTDEDGVQHVDLKQGQVGEIRYQLKWQEHTEEFPWLFLNFEELIEAIEPIGLQGHLLMKSENSYLASIRHNGQ